MTLIQQLKKNIMSSWVVYAIRIVITFFFIPYITSVLGDARYGAWVILFQLINYFALPVQGVRDALTRSVARYLGRQDDDGINRILNTATLILIGIAVLILIITHFLALWFFGLLKISDPAILAESRHAFLFVALYLAVRLVLTPFGGSQGAFQRYDIANVLNIGEEILKTALMVVVLYQGYGLAELALVIFGTSTLRMLLGVIINKRLHPGMKISGRFLDKSAARELYNYSIIMLGITIGWLVVFNTDTVLLGVMATTAAAGVYAPAAQMMLYLRNIVNAVGMPLTPAIAQLDGENKREEITRLYLKGSRYIAYLSFFLTAGVIVFARAFVALWLAPEFAEAAEAIIILAIGSAVFLPQIIGNSVLFGLARHKYILFVLIFESAMKIILAVFLIDRWGLIGMAAAVSIPQVLLYSTVYPLFISRVLKIPLSMLLFNLLKGSVTALVTTLPIALFLNYILPPDNWFFFAIDILATSVVAILPAWFLVVERE